MRKPTLLYTSPKGTTIHSYDIEGGHRTFNHYLKCYEGSCEFHETLDQARKAVKFWHNFVKSIPYWERFAIPPWPLLKSPDPARRFASRSLWWCFFLWSHVLSVHYWRWLSELRSNERDISCAYVSECLLICAPMLTLRHKQFISLFHSVTTYWLILWSMLY